MLKKITALLLVLSTAICFVSGCSTDTTTNQKVEQPHLYWKTVDAAVTDVSKMHWFAGVHRYSLSITVYSAEYGLEETFDNETSGIYLPDGWDLEEGGHCKVEMYSWVMDSTGEVIRRELNRIVQ